MKTDTMVVNHDWDDMEKLFSEKRFSAYDFFRVLFAQLSIMKQHIIRKSDIVKNLYVLNSNKNYTELLSDIGFRTSGNMVYSQDVEDCIAELQTHGMIGKLNPTFENIVIYIDDEIASVILGFYDLDVVQKIEKLTIEFIEKVNSNAV